MKTWILSLVLAYVIAKKNILLSAGHYMNGHLTPFIVLAKRISKEPDFNCFVVAEEESRSKWEGINCEVLYIGDEESSKKSRSLIDLFLKEAAAGNFSSMNYFKKSLMVGYENWQEVNIFKKLEEKGIEIAICDVFNFGCSLSIHKLNISKSVYVSTACIPWCFTAHEFDPNYIPIGSMNGFESEIGFFTRLKNTLFANFISIHSLQFQNEITQEYVPFIHENDWKSNTLYKREAIYIMPCIPSFNHPESVAPNLIHSGPLVDRNPEALPNEISEFLKPFSSRIYFSFGTLSKGTNFKVVFNLAKNNPHIGFVISYFSSDRTENLEIPSNCLVLDWVPQISLMANGNIDLFITHAGWNSVSEALFYGVPMIACGWSLDREFFGVLIQRRKVGRTISSENEFKEDVLQKEVYEVLNNPVYRKNIKAYSNALKGWDTEGKIIDWIKLYLELGIENLVIESRYTMNWFKLKQLDIYGFILVIGILALGIVFFLIRILWRCIRKSRIDDINRPKKE